MSTLDAKPYLGRVGRRARQGERSRKSVGPLHSEWRVGTASKQNGVKERFRSEGGVLRCYEKYGLTGLAGVRSHPVREFGFLKVPCRQLHHGLRRIWLASKELIAIQFEKQYPRDENCTLVAIHKGVIANDSRSVGCRH